MKYSLVWRHRLNSFFISFTNEWYDEPNLYTFCSKDPLTVIC